MTDQATAFDYLDTFWFVVLPYVALFTFFLVTMLRYTKRGFTYSTLSSQFLENRFHFWAMVPFHYGILAVLGGHLLAFLLPRQVLALTREPLRLYVIEIALFVAAVFTLVGLINIMIRRHTDTKSRMVTSTADWLVFAVILVQVGTGIYTAIFKGWGSTWFAASLAPYLWSLVRLSPETAYVVALPTVVKLHIIGAWALILLFPFTRLVHILVVPNPYLWRKPQLVRWYWDRKKIRNV